MRCDFLSGDCLDGLRETDSETIDLTVTSCPYGDMRPQYPSMDRELFESVADELFRTTKEGGVVCWQEGDQAIDGSYRCGPEEHLLYFRDIGFSVWDKIVTGINGSRFGSNRRYFPSLVFVYVLSKGVPKTVNILRDRPNKSPGAPYKHNERDCYGDVVYDDKTYYIQPFGKRRTVWLYGQMGHTEKGYWSHPATMHNRLAEDLIRSYSNAWDLVCDPFAGVATTGKHAILNGRQFVGWEIMPKYHALGLRRLETANMERWDTLLGV